MNFLENISVVWQKLNLVQRAMLMAILVAGGITAVFLTKWASKPDMRPLYSNLSDEDAGKITDKLAEKNITFEMRGTSNIYVPKEHVYQLRADLAKDGLPGNSSEGYGLLDDTKIGTSPMQMGVTINRALEGELARSITMIDTIVGARVHINRPEQNVFGSEEAKSTASVVLNVKPGFRVTQATVAAITHMVSGGVQGLEADGVTVVDNRGNLVSTNNENGKTRSAYDMSSYRSSTEEELAYKVQRMLETFLGPGRSNVTVSAELDMTSEETLTTKYEKGIAETEEINTTTKVVSAGTDADGNPLGEGEEEGEENIQTKYRLPETTMKTEKIAGGIKSISVSCIVDLTIDPDPAEAKEGEAAAAPKKILSVEKVENLILKALAKNNLLKEDLAVEDVPFLRPVLPEPVQEPWHIAYIGLVKQSSLGIMAVCALLALKIFSGKVKPSKGSKSVAQISGGEGGVAALPAGDMREQIALAYRSDPEQVKELFTSWIEEKG